MSGVCCSLFLAIILLFISQIGLAADFYAMGCKPTEMPKQGVSKPAEQALPPVKKQPSLQKSSDQKIAQKKLKKIESNRLQQVGAFRTKRNAESLMKKLKEEGQEAVMHVSVTKDKKRFYKVFVMRSQGASKKEFISSETGYDRLQKLSPEEKSVVVEKFPEEHKELPKDTLSSGEIRYKSVPEKKSVEEQTVGDKRIAVEQRAVSGDITRSGDIKKEIAPVSQPAEDKPIGGVQERSAGDIFGSRGGLVHPFLSVTEYYTDNVFYAKKDKQNDFATILSPGIWLTIPHVYEKLLHIETANISPGGFSLGKSVPETFKRYQLYLFYNADIERFSRFSSQNADNHRAEGFLQYNLKSGFSLELVDQFIASHDERGTGTTSQLDKFKSNLSNITLSYNISDRFKLRADYSNFLVDYSARRNDFRDRDDNAVSGYLFYKIRPRASLFVEYEFIDIGFKEDPSFNSKEYNGFGGIQWDITAKSKGTVKAGYGAKDFTNPAIKSENNFIMEAQIDYQFTPKTSIILKGSRRTNETNVQGTDFILSNYVELQYLQKLTGKITADIKLAYTRDSYKGTVTSNGTTGRLKDNYYLGVFALQYKFKEWLQMDLGYIYDKRDSNFSEFDYMSDIVFLRVTGSL